MASTRKPNPKTQREISNGLVDPYVNDETGETIGNPNPSQFEQFTHNEQSGVDANRSNVQSFKGDTTKPFNVGLMDIDESIIYYFNNVIRPSVHQNGTQIPVPIIYGSPEKWKSTQKDGYYKDKNGAIMSPIIMFKRDSIDKNRAAWNKMDANSPHHYSSWKKIYNNKNSYSNFSTLTNRVPTEQFIVNVIPDYVKISYSCVIQTYYVEQLNKIIEAINYASDSYWGNPERFKFKASVDSFSTITELKDGEDRVVKSTFTINLYGYIVPDNIQKELTAVKKFNSKSQVIIGLETTIIPGSAPITGSQFAPLFIDGQQLIINYLSPTVLSYLNTNVQRLGTFINSTTVTFASGWLTAPNGLPPTSLDNFSIFCNGVLIENAAIVSFTESNGITTLVIDVFELGYGFTPTDEIVAIGKFI